MDLVQPGAIRICDKNGVEYHYVPNKQRDPNRYEVFRFVNGEQNGTWSIDSTELIKELVGNVIENRF